MPEHNRIQNEIQQCDDLMLQTRLKALINNQLSIKQIDGSTWKVLEGDNKIGQINFPSEVKEKPFHAFYLKEKPSINSPAGISVDVGVFETKEEGADKIYWKHRSRIIISES